MWIVHLLGGLGHAASKHALDESRGPLLELRRLVTWIRPVPLVCDHCRVRFVALTWGRRRFTNIGDPDLRDELVAEIESQIGRYLTTVMSSDRQISYDARCPSCSRLPVWMVRRAWTRHLAVAVGVPTVAAMVGTWLSTQLLSDPLATRLILSICGASAALGIAYTMLQLSPSSLRRLFGSDRRVRSAAGPSPAQTNGTLDPEPILQWYKACGGRPVSEGRLFILSDTTASLVT